MTAAAKHTPGQWTVDEDRGHIIGPDFGAIGASTVAIVSRLHNTRGDDDPQTMRLRGEANARLIAAAPDLLNALRDVLNMHAMDGHMQGTFYRDTTGAMQRARAAIARATGDQS